MAWIHSCLCLIAVGDEEYSKLQYFGSSSMLSLQAMSCTQSAMALPTNHAPLLEAPPTGHAPLLEAPPIGHALSFSKYQEQSQESSVKYTQLNFVEPDSPTESSGGVENHRILQSNAWYVITMEINKTISVCVCVRCVLYNLYNNINLC